MTLAEGFSAAGVSVFVVDAKGDLSALARSTPARFLDCFGEQGDHARLSMARLGPELLARVLGLSDAQSGVLEILFAIAESRGVAVHTMADLAAVIRFARDNAGDIREQFGHFTPTSLSAIGRALLKLEREGGREFFGAESFDFVNLFGDEADGRGRVSILEADRLLRSPSLYAAFMVHLLADIERMPEAGDQPAPRLVLFIDEAHLLFQDCPPGVLQRIERTIRLIRSKGVGVYFVTQSPADIPPNVLGQLGNRIQHALRGATPAHIRSIKAAADTLPALPNFDAASAIAALGVGFALVSTIGPDGEPRLVERVRVSLPRCPLGPLKRPERPRIAARVPGPPASHGSPLPGAVAGGNVNPVFAGAVVLVAVGAAGVVLYFWWKWAIAISLAGFLFLRRAIRA
jgi:hypothetical protein